jgi:hypothetical protein
MVRVDAPTPTQPPTQCGSGGHPFARRQYHVLVGGEIFVCGLRVVFLKMCKESLLLCRTVVCDFIESRCVTIMAM